MSNLIQVRRERIYVATQSYSHTLLLQSIDMHSPFQLRKKYGDDYEKKFGSKLSFLSVFVRASISAPR